MERGRERRHVGPAGIAVIVLAAVLGLAVVSGSLAGSRSSATESATFAIPAASSTWFDTGLLIPRDAPIGLEAASNATCHAPTGPNCEVGKSTGQRCSAFGIAPGPAGDAIPFAEFAGKLGPHGTPFAIEKEAMELGPGRLFLVYNDCGPPSGYGDNAGGANIIVSGTLHKRPKRPTAPVKPVVKPKKGTVIGTVSEVHGDAYVTRGGKTVPLELHDPIEFGDVVGTKKGSSLSFDFSLGGRTGIAPGTEVTVGERSVTADGKTTLKAELNVAASVGKLKEPLEIQQNGQNTGVKG